MSIVQFLRIFWARRLLIVAATVSCFVGAMIVCAVLPPRWEASSRVMLDVLKPDPVSGEIIAGPAARMYVDTQVELITDYSVAGQVADQIGLLSDPALIAQYQSRGSRDKRDFRHWAAQLIIDNTKAKLLEDSNILEITYTAPTPDNAKAVADALRKAYIDYSLTFKRETAERNAEWFSAQADKAKAAMDAAIAAESNYEKANGLVMANDKLDMDSARLQALAGASGVAPAMIAPSAVTSPAAEELGQVDAQIATLSKDLGPNNPTMIQLKAKRAALAVTAEQERGAARAAAGAASAGVGALDRAVAAAKARVLAQSDKIGKLTQLQAEVDLRRDEFDKTSARAAEFRQQAVSAETGITPLADAVTPRSPAFPNYMLIVPGSIALGLGVGVLVALLMELFGRRVRGVEDLSSAIDAPLLAVIAAPPKPGRAARPRQSTGMKLSGRRKPVPA